MDRSGQVLPILEQYKEVETQHGVHNTYQNREAVHSENKEASVQTKMVEAHSSVSDTVESEMPKKDMEALKRSKERWSLRRRNCQCRTTTKTIIDQDDYRLESSLKKCTALVRKLKSVSRDTKESLLAEIQTLNLSMYISEICGAFFEARFRIADVPAVVEVISEIYRRYPEFTDHFVEHLSRNISQSSGLDWNTKRSFLHLVVELCCVNILPSFKLVAFLKETNKSTNIGSDLASAVNAFTSLAKNYLAELLIFPPTDCDNPLSEIEYKKGWEYWILSQEEKKQIFGIYESLFEKSCSVLNELQREITDLEKETSVSRQMQGEVQQDTQNIFQSKRKQFIKLSSNIKTLCSLLGFQMPIIIIQDEEKQSNIHSPNSLDSYSNTFTQETETEKPQKSCFETEAERKFYEDLPSIVVLDSPVVQQDIQEEKKKDQNENVESSLNGNNSISREQSDKSRLSEDALSSLLSCSDMDEIDKWCLENWSIFKKSQIRKKLVKVLFNFSFANPEMVPLASRLVAALNPIYPDIAANVTQVLKDDFMSYFEKKETGEHHLKCRIWNARWISEMTKFRLFPAHVVLNYVKLCLEDFSHYNVDIVCAILESCGQFLYNKSETEYRTSSLLDILWRLRSVKNLEPRHEVMVENAYYTVRPLNAKQEKNAEREPLKEFIHHILFETRYHYRELPWLVKKLRKLPCTMEMETFLVDEFLQTEKFPYDCLGDMSKVITEYSKYRDSIGIGIVDGIVEAIFCLLENQDNRFLQQRLAQLKLLGELFKTRFVNGRFIMNLAYCIISYGWNESLLVEQENGLFVRVRMVCSLLETCGLELLDTVSFRKMETFLLHLFQMIWQSSKGIGTGEDLSIKVLSLLPIHLQHLVTEIAEMYSASSLASITGGQLTEKWEQLVDKVNSVPDLTIGSLQKTNITTSYSASNDGTSRSEDSFSEEMNSMKRDWSFSSYKEADEREEIIASEDEVGSSSTSHPEEEGATEVASLGDQGEGLENADKSSVHDSESLSEDSEVEEEDTEISNAPRKEQERESFDQEIFAILTESLSEASQNRNAASSSSSFRPLLSSARNVMNNNINSLRNQEKQQHGMDENVPFQVLMRRGGKPQVRLLNIPSNSSLVTASRAVDEMEKEEKEELKRLVLTSTTMQRKGRHRKR
ncbi:Regulator of nonsense transcripts UPF2 [Galdieria sulphuraria]|uniref:RNA-binding protein n=1 Tax=Galdieria sulphuraria TaxID=130081 RepID=M2Y2G9_GALSU|nr:RNA-binding protein [Galdieria sulphuraria]EME30009.1 RNA-binding protein [Galdieria sulphuraria]GJD06220.1 Regulator of nonsense transcripts UPF2 [Galdieria sulphuraria]|eukprot:XP_005706529.1 RNA-binding protein [Galdieria sulphuraria]